MKKRNRTACLMLFAGFVLCGFLGAQDGFLSLQWPLPQPQSPSSWNRSRFSRAHLPPFVRRTAAPPMQPASCSLCPKRSLNV